MTPTARRRAGDRAVPLVGLRLASLAVALLFAACTPAPTAGPSPSPGPPTPAPTAATWVQTGSMLEPRWGHSATLLEDGRVLVAGGIPVTFPENENPRALSSVELFDPATGQWTAGPPMLHVRRGHSAIRLADGRVLLFGGTLQQAPDIGPNPFAEVYDPATNTWSVVQPTDVAGNQPAVLLADGRVVITGTHPSYYTVAQPEVDAFDPASKTWTTVASGDEVASALESMRAGLSVLLAPPPITGDPTIAVRLADGRVLVWIKHVARIFDPSEPAWVDPAAPGTNSLGLDSVLLADGRVLFMDAWSCTELAPPVLYDPTADRWSPIGEVPSSYRTTSTLLADGRVLVAGGGPRCADAGHPAPPSGDAYLLDPAAHA